MPLDTRFVHGLEDNTRKTVIDLLNARLADMIALSLAVKQAHWNMKGRGFIGVHELLDDVVERLRESADLIAERAQIIGGVAEGTVDIAASRGEMERYPTDLVEVEDHVRALTERFADVGARIRKAIEESSDAGDADTEDLFTEVSRQVDKDAWFIGSNAPSR
ncbi:starvation-inducible DNA-binding protein [Hasllibacter halocynthiae]|uniref:Starvation-inducible DNA-binding protein n=1 Tax=Hasllibacter halocynthiae TaxID=595589 RepID=A0A2T0X2I8_9RHOB|nr:DNA starvation/stationary phase protection protein Dps [Hasllibacter halocynthiae]PRY93172.1 starvation-inducible DNA-binding protein [Hasllibacter halocynthiae]